MTFITDEMRQALSPGGCIYALTEQRMAADPFFAEDIASINESMPYLIRYEGSRPPVRCECCGTLVRDPLEAPLGRASHMEAGHLGSRDRPEAHAQAL